MLLVPRRLCAGYCNLCETLRTMLPRTQCIRVRRRRYDLCWQAPGSAASVTALPLRQRYRRECWGNYCARQFRLRQGPRSHFSRESGKEAELVPHAKGAIATRISELGDGFQEILVRVNWSVVNANLVVEMWASAASAVPEVADDLTPPHALTGGDSET